MNTKNKELYIIIILAIALFLVTLIGTSYAFFSLKIKGNEQAKPITIKTAEIYVEYKKYSEIIAENIFPGWEDTLSFSVHNITELEDVPATYQINWNISENTINNDDLVYILEGKVYRDNKEIEPSKYDKLPGGNKELKVPTISTSLGTGMVNSGNVHIYNLTIKLKETTKNQNDLQNKRFAGRIELK